MTNRARLIEATISAVAVLALGEAAAAQDARWKASPPGNDWNNPADWDPATVPTGTASFGASSRTEIVFSQRNIAVGRMLFESGAPAYTFVLDGGQRLRVTGFGIENLSASPATFLIGTRPTNIFPSSDPFSPEVRFEGSSTAGNSVFMIGLPDGCCDGYVIFRDTSSAATATITNYYLIHFEGSSSGGRSRITNSAGIRLKETATLDQATIDNIHGGYVIFESNSTAARASIRNANALTYFQALSTAGSSHIVNETGPIRAGSRTNIGLPTSLGDVVSESEQETGLTAFRGNSRAGTATIVNNAGAGAFVPGFGLTLSRTGGTIFDEDSSAENAAITNNGGTSGAFLRITGPRSTQLIETNNAAVTFFALRASAANATIVNNNAAWTVFFDQSSADAATITTNSGSTVLFRDQSNGGTARFINYAGGTFDISGLTAAGTQAGSIEGAGAVRLGGKRLTLGGNNRSTETSGIISDGGFSGGSGGSLVKTGTGTLTLTGANTYTGGTTINSGTLQIGNGGPTGSIAGNIADDGMLVFNRSDAVTYAGVVSGTGALRKTGTGTLTLSGASTYTGATTVAGGTLLVNGSLVSGVTVNSGTRLGGTGRIGGLTVAGTLAPGNSIGTINVAGNTTFAAGSTYEVEVDGAGNSDKTLVTGSATLQGGTVAALFQGQAEQCGAPFRYTILTAQGGVSGAFAAVTSNFAFLAPSLSYDPNNVFLTLTRAPGTFADHGTSSNQQRTAAAAEALNCGNAVFDPLVRLSSAAAGAAFDQLSGEIHASTRGALFEDSRFVREAMLAGREERRRLWVHGYGSWGETEANGNTAALDRNSSGLLAGFDLPIGSHWSARLGGGYSHARFSADALVSTARLDTWHVGGRIAGRFGGLGVAAGAALSWHEIDTERSIAFPGFSDNASARYDGRTAQFFAEAGYALPIGGGASVEPFVRGAWVDMKTDAFAEAGGAAALSGADASDDVGFATLGLKAKAEVGAIALTGTAGWRHAFSLEPSEASLAFDGGAPFTVTGAPIAGDALTLEAGVEVSLGSGGRLGLAYSGQIARRSEDHGARAVLSLGF